MFPSLAVALDDSTIPWKTIGTWFLIANSAFKAYIFHRQYTATFLKNPPRAIREEVTLEQFKKSQDYAKNRIKLRGFKVVFNLAEELFILKFDIMPRLWIFSGQILLGLDRFNWINGIAGSVALQSVIFVAVKKSLSQLMGLPALFYSDFVIEKKWQAKRTTGADFIKHHILSLLLNNIVFGPTVYLFFKVSESLGPGLIDYAFSLYMVATSLFQFIFLDSILPLFYNLKVMEDGELKLAIHKILGMNGLSDAQVYILPGIPESGSRIFFAGSPWKRYLVLYDSLVNSLSEKEIIALVSNEVSRSKWTNTLQKTVMFQASGVAQIILYSGFSDNVSLATSFGFKEPNPVINFMLFSYINWPISIAFSIANNLLIRKIEFQADNHAKVQGFKDDLATGFIRFHTIDMRRLYADWFYDLCEREHPSVVDRLAAIGYEPRRKVGVDREDSHEN